MNYRKGLTRITIVWLGAWGLWGWGGYQMYMDAERGYLEASAREWNFAMSYHDKMMTRGNEQISQALICGLMVPILLTIVAILAFWVCRGFKPKIAAGVN